MHHPRRPGEVRDEISSCSRVSLTLAVTMATATASSYFQNRNGNHVMVQLHEHTTIMELVGNSFCKLDVAAERPRGSACPDDRRCPCDDCGQMMGTPRRQSASLMMITSLDSGQNQSAVCSGPSLQPSGSFGQVSLLDWTCRRGQVRLPSMLVETSVSAATAGPAGG